MPNKIDFVYCKSDDNVYIYSEGYPVISMATLEKVFKGIKTWSSHAE